MTNRRTRARGRFVSTAVVALLTALAATTPAVAKPGGGKPGASGLVVAVEAGRIMWANSPGDTIPFDITVTNKSGGPLTVTVQFEKDAFVPVQVAQVDLGKGEAWTGQYLYTVVGTIDENGNTGDFAGVSIGGDTEVTAGTVAAHADGVSATAEAVMTVHPVLPCPDGATDSFTFGPHTQYTVCSFTPSDLPAYWDLKTTRAKPQRGKGAYSPSATVRDGIPGNWCNHDLAGQIPQETDADGVVTDRVFFPADGVCLNGGAGGQTIPVRNTDTFYLATWTQNTVEAARDTSGG